jgi:hypothetical protein
MIPENFPGEWGRCATGLRMLTEDTALGLHVFTAVIGKGTL